MENKPETVDIVEHCIGSKGRWQYRLCLIMIPLRITIAWFQLSFVYLAPPIQFHCSNITIPECSPECPSHIFSTDVFTQTIVSEWDLVCEYSQLANIAQMVFMFGILVGSVLFGYLADRFGRRKSIVLATVIQGVTGVGAAVAPSYWIFVLLRFLSAASSGGNLIVNFILIVEIFGKKWRTPLAIIMQVPLMLGHSSLGLLAYYIRHWRYYQFGISVPAVFLISYYWILPESPRWLLATGRKEEAISLMKNAAAINKLPTDMIAEYINTQLLNTVPKPTGNMKDLLQTPKMRIRSIVLFINWFVCGFCFYGLSQIISQFGNIFISLSIPALIQIPFCLSSIYFIERFGRKNCIYVLNTIIPLCLFTIIVVPTNFLPILFGGFAFVLCSLSFSTFYIFTGELFPTVVRNVGAGLASMFSRIGAMIAPFVASSHSGLSWLPLLLFGCAPLIGAALCFFLPETKQTILPNTVEEVETMNIKDKSKYDLNQISPDQPTISE